MTKKELYTSPEVDVFVIQTEGVVCQSPGAWDGSIQGGTNWGDGDVDFGLF